MECPFFHVFMLDDLFQSVDDDSSDQQMGTMWKKLPRELLEEILLRLPFACQARCKALCKAWKRTLSSQVFKKQSAAIAFSSGRYICGFVHSNILGFDLPLKDLEVHYKMHKLNLDFLPEDLRKFLQYHGYCTYRPMSNEGLVTMGRFECRLGQHGPYCERSFEAGDKCLAVRLCVVNPLDKIWRELPSLHVDYNADVMEICLERDEENRPGFKVFVTYESSDDETGDRFWVYISSTNAWSKLPGIAERTTPSFSSQAETSLSHTVNGEPILIPILLNRCEIWGLHRSKRYWVLLSSLPDELLAKVRAISREGEDKQVEKDEGLREPKESSSVSMHHVLVSYCQPAGDVIFLTLEVGEERLCQVVAYHVVKQSWQIVLCYHPPRDDWKCTSIDHHSDWQTILAGRDLDFVQLPSVLTL